MSDNTTITPGTGATVATDLISTVHHQRVKMEWGADGVANDVSAVNPLPTTNPQRVTYQANFRLAARPYALSKVFTANTRVQFATLHHAAVSTKTVRISRVLVTVVGNTVAAILNADLVFITTAPATGNPAVTPSPLNRASAAADATALALPTTAGTEGALIATTQWNLGIMGAASTANPPPAPTIVMLYDYVIGHEDEPITLRAGTLEGIALVIDANAATTVTAYVSIEFTEI